MTGLPQTRSVVLGLIAGLGTLAGVAAAQPVNDNFANATVLTGTFGTVTEDNSTATTEPGEPKHAGVLKNASIWFQWKAPANGEVTMDTLGSAVSTTFFGQTTTTYLDTVLAVYTGTALTNLSVVAANDDTGSSSNSLVI